MTQRRPQDKQLVNRSSRNAVVRKTEILIAEAWVLAAQTWPNLVLF